MSPSLGQAVLELVTDGDKLKAGLQEAGGAARAWGGKMIQAGGDIANGLRPLTGVIDDVIKNSVNMASSTEESLNKVRVVFGAAAGSIEEWANTSATALGLSRQKALDAAGTFGNLFTAMGLGKPEAAGLSKNVVQLAADLASFNNIKPEEALEKLRAGLIGEAEPLRTLGVNLSEAAVKAYAMANGIGTAAGVMTDGEKIRARFGLITQQTSSAQGDFARTSDGLANSLRIQKAEQENVQAQLGASLLPAMKTLTELTTNVMRAFASLSPEIQTGIMIVGGLLLVLGPLLTVLGVITSAFGLLIAIMIPAQGSLLATTIAIGGMNIALGPLILIIGALALAALLLKLAWENNWGGIRETTAAAVAFWKDAFDGLRIFVLQVWRGIVVGIANAVNGVIGVINGFIDIYNAMAGRLGLPTIARIELITPNLAAVDREIEIAARNRTSTITVVTVAQGGHAVTEYASGTDHITRGPELFLAGEAGAERVQVTPLGSGGGAPGSAFGGAGGHAHDIVMDGRVVAAALGRRTVRGAAFAGGAIG